MTRPKLGAETTAARLWARVQKTATCWLWTGGPAKGYGLIRVDGKVTRTHRLSYLLNIGPIPEGLGVLHKCDTPKCVRPDHLFLGTDADNSADKIAKGRQGAAGRKSIWFLHPRQQLPPPLPRASDEIAALKASGEWDALVKESEAARQPPTPRRSRRPRLRPASGPV